MRRHRKVLRPVTEINLTSLLDVAFVLLIAFMIVAPSLKRGFDLELPTVSEGAPAIGGAQPGPITLAVPKPVGGVQDYLLNGQPVPLSDIESRLREARARNPKVAVEIEADKGVPYEAFVRAVGAVRRAGIEAVGLPVEAGSVEAPASRVTATPVPENKKP